MHAGKRTKLVCLLFVSTAKFIFRLSGQNITHTHTADGNNSLVCVSVCVWRNVYPTGSWTCRPDNAARHTPAYKQTEMVECRKWALD